MYVFVYFNLYLQKKWWMRREYKGWRYGGKEEEMVLVSQPPSKVQKKIHVLLRPPFVCMFTLLWSVFKILYEKECMSLLV